MKKFSFILVALIGFSIISANAQSVTMTKEKDRTYVMNNGTIHTVSSNDDLSFIQLKNVKWSCNFDFEPYRGRIVNMSNRKLTFKVTCIDCNNVKNPIQIIIVEPNTFQRILFASKDNYAIKINKIKCENQ